MSPSISQCLISKDSIHLFVLSFTFLVSITFTLCPSFILHFYFCFSIFLSLFLSSFLTPSNFHSDSFSMSLLLSFSLYLFLSLSFSPSISISLSHSLSLLQSHYSVLNIMRLSSPACKCLPLTAWKQCPYTARDSLVFQVKDIFIACTAFFIVFVKKLSSCLSSKNIKIWFFFQHFLLFYSYFSTKKN